jgi:uncharacterized protein
MRPAPVGCAAFVACFFLSLAQCDRAPPEPVGTASAKSKSRCLVATSEKPPAPVAPGPDAACPVDPDGGPPQVPMGKVTFLGAPKAPALETEVMVAEAHRNRGLMYRREMPEAHAMLFVFEDQQVRTFWMHNTCLPLDMLFVASDGYITGVLENVPTMNDDPRSIPCKAKYVLEVNAGFARRHGVRAGQSIKIEGAP